MTVYAYLRVSTDQQDVDNQRWLLLDSRVVDMPMAYNPTFVMLSSLKSLFFNSRKNAFRFLDNVGAKAPGIQ
jgi:hypothetical protein